MNIVKQAVGFFLVALAVGLVGLAGLAYFEPSQAAARDELAALQVEQAAQQAALNGAAAAQQVSLSMERDASLAGLYTLLAAWWALTPALLMGLLLAALTGAVVISIDAYRLRRIPLIRANESGLLPVARRALERDATASLALLGLYQQRELMRASIPARVTIRGSEQHGGQVVDVPQVEELRGLPVAPSFSQLWADGFRPTAERLLLGYGAQGPIYGSVADLLSVLLVGKSGTGKSTYLRLVAAQLAVIGAQVGILDPHGSIGEDCPIATVWRAEDEKEFSRTAAQLCRELDNRLSQRKAGKRDFVPGLILADEWNILSGLSPACGEVLRRIILEGRKVGLFCVIAGHAPTAKSFGDSTARDGMSSRVIFNCERRQAIMGGLPLDDARRLLPILAGAPRGHAILHRSAHNAEIIAVPNITTGDLALCQIPTTTRYKATAKPLQSEGNGSGNGSGEIVDAVVGRVAGPVVDSEPYQHPDAERILALWWADVSLTKIVKEIFNVSAGAEFNKRADEVRQVIKSQMRRPPYAS